MRRKKKRITKPEKAGRSRLALYAILAALVAIFVLSLFVAYNDRLLISSISVEGNKTVSDDEIRHLIEEKLSGKYWYLYPKRNALIYPAGDVLTAVSQSFPRLSSIKLEEGELSELSLSVVERRGQYLWCLPDTNCFFSDETGFVFSPAPRFSGHLYFEFVATSTDELVGKQPLPEDDFRRIVGLKEDLSSVLADSVLEASTVYRVEPEELNDWHYLVEASDGRSWEIRFDLSQDMNIALRALRSILADQKFIDELAENEYRLEYIDLRFVPKIFYRFHK